MTLQMQARPAIITHCHKYMATYAESLADKAQDKLHIIGIFMPGTHRTIASLQSHLQAPMNKCLHDYTFKANN